MKNIEGFSFDSTFLNVKSLDLIPAAFTPNSLNDFEKLFNFVLLPLLAFFFLVESILMDFLSDFVCPPLLEDPGLPRLFEKPDCWT